MWAASARGRGSVAGRSTSSLELTEASLAPILIDALSLTSLYLKIQVNGQQLSTATGFVVSRGAKYFLITNRHVLSGRHPETGKLLSPTAAIPDEVRIAHHRKSALGSWQFHGEQLLKPDGSPRWLSHPKGADVDVVALELEAIGFDTRIYPLDLGLADVDLVVQPAMAVSVIGFPLGLRPNVFFPIWKTGHIATDPGIPYGGRPAFLIDATTRAGMSGSPVVARVSGGYMSSQAYVVASGVVTKFLGVYASRIHEDVEIGCVWRPEVITEILDAMVFGEL